MSDHFLHFIPQNPRYVPARAARDAARQHARTILDRADSVTIKATESVHFVDAGGNFESVVCPLCAATLDTRWWIAAMNRSFAVEFVDLSVTTPCCTGRTSLNDLHYVWPQGFARFVLEVQNANVGSDLPGTLLPDLERILACELRVIRTHD